MLEYDETEDLKKDATKQFSESLKALRGQMRSLSKKIRAKGEVRSVECVVRFHNPAIGEKTTIRTDTGEIVCIEPMSSDERQENLFGELKELENMFGAGGQEPPDAPGTSV